MDRQILAQNTALNTVFCAQTDLIWAWEGKSHVSLTVQSHGLGTQIWTIGQFQTPSTAGYDAHKFMSKIVFLLQSFESVYRKRRAWKADYE